MDLKSPIIYSLEYWRELLIPKGFDTPYFHSRPNYSGYYIFRKGKMDFCLLHPHLEDVYRNFFFTYDGTKVVETQHLPLFVDTEEGRKCTAWKGRSSMDQEPFIHLQQLLEAMGNPDLLPSCLHIPWAGYLLEHLIKEWAKT